MGPYSKKTTNAPDEVLAKAIPPSSKGNYCGCTTGDDSSSMDLAGYLKSGGPPQGVSGILNFSVSPTGPPATQANQFVTLSQLNSGSSYSFTNGLTNTFGTVTLGGGISNTTLSFVGEATFQLGNLGNNGSQLLLYSDGTIGNIYLNAASSNFDNSLTFRGSTDSYGPDGSIALEHIRKSDSKTIGLYLGANVPGASVAHSYFSDQINNLGLEYFEDYSSNWSSATPRVIPDIGWILSQGYSTSTYTFNSGLTNISGTITLGGSLLQDTILDVSNNSLIISGSTGTNSITGTFTNSQISLLSSDSSTNTAGVLGLNTSDVVLGLSYDSNTTSSLITFNADNTGASVDIRTKGTTYQSSFGTLSQNFIGGLEYPRFGTEIALLSDLTNSVTGISIETDITAIRFGIIVQDSLFSKGFTYYNDYSSAWSSSTPNAIPSVQWILAQISSGGGGGAVSSFNTRTGAITLTSSDVTSALTFTPYNATNPSGYITSSALSPYLTSSSATTTYVSLAGSYANPSWITSLAYSKLTGTPAIYSFTGSSSQYTKGDGTYGTLPSSGITALTGDIAASGSGSVAATLATVNTNVGTFNNVTVNAKGLVTAATAVSYQTPLTFDTTPTSGSSNPVTSGGIYTALNSGPTLSVTSGLTLSGSAVLGIDNTIVALLAQANAFTAAQSITSTTTNQFSINYDGTNNTTFAVASNGQLTITASGGYATFASNLFVSNTNFLLLSNGGAIKALDNTSNQHYVQYYDTSNGVNYASLGNGSVWWNIDLGAELMQLSETGSLKLNTYAAGVLSTNSGNDVVSSVTPNLYTPSAITLTNGTGLPLTGLAGAPANGTIPIGNGTNYVNAAITGTANEIVVTPGAGSITLSTPQAIATSSAPQFASLGIGTGFSSSTYYVSSGGTTSKSLMRWPTGAAPTTPVSGDFWRTTGNGLFFYDGATAQQLPFLATTNTWTGVNKFLDFYATSTVPTQVAGTGAGTTPTISIVGNNMDGRITITTGALPTASGVVTTITMSGSFAYPTSTTCILEPGNALTAALSGTSQVFVTGTTTTFVITAGTVGLVAATTYIWNYHNGGY